MQFIDIPPPPYYVPDPEIPEVLNLSDGSYQTLAEVVGDVYGDAVKKRLEIKDAIASGVPLYACAECGVPVNLLSRMDTRRFHFKHTLEDSRCSAITRGDLDHNEITARKYNGAKESRLHHRIKKLVRQSLEADPHFSEISVEETWKGLNGSWRKPDVQALYHRPDGEPVRVAFEIQLSTTFLDVIVERRRFYMGERGLLFWVFAEFNDSRRRLTQDDVFYNNNQNAFVMNEEIALHSIAEKGLHFECTWAEPLTPTADHSLKKQTVAFADLVLDIEDQKAFYFDYHAAKATLVRQEESSLMRVRDAFETAWIADARYSRNSPKLWQDFYRGLRKAGVSPPNYPQNPHDILINALYSAKHGRVIGWGYNKLIEVAHRIAGGHPQYLRVFGRALTLYGRSDQIRAEDKSGLWKQKMLKLRPALRAKAQEYEHDFRYDEILGILFPELW